MPESKVITFRFSPELLARIDFYAGRLMARAGGVRVARTRVVVKLLELGLDQVETETIGTRRKR